MITLYYLRVKTNLPLKERSDAHFAIWWLMLDQDIPKIKLKEHGSDVFYTEEALTLILLRYGHVFDITRIEVENDSIQI